MTIPTKMIDRRCATLPKPDDRGKNAVLAAMAGERRKNSFVVARHGVLQSTMVFEHLRKKPRLDYITTKIQGGQEKNILR